MENKKNVLLAFTGGRNSLAAAYLLLKQGYGVTACIFLMGDLKSSCSLISLDKAKEACRILGIGHIQIDLQAEFTEKVINTLISARLEGEDFNPCYHCNILRAQVLLKKANELNFDYIATGHVASIFQEPYGIKLLPGREEDQSFFISGLRENLLQKMLLPLGKLTQEEIEKVTYSLGFDFAGDKQQSKICLDDMEEIIRLVEKSVPISLRNEGLIVNQTTKMAFGNHKGIYNFKLGMRNLAAWDSNISVDSTIIGFDLNKKEVLVSENPIFVQDELEIYSFNPFGDIDLSSPLQLFLSFSPAGEKISCTVYPGNGQMALVKMAQKVEGPLDRGKLVVFYEGENANPRLVATGFITKTGISEETERDQTFFIN